MLEAAIALGILAIIAAPLVILARSEQLPWDHPSGVTIPGATREEIAQDLNVDPADLDPEDDNGNDQ